MPPLGQPKTRFESDWEEGEGADRALLDSKRREESKWVYIVANEYVCMKPWKKIKGLERPFRLVSCR